MLQKYCIALEDIVYWAQCGAPLHEKDNAGGNCNNEGKGIGQRL